MNNPNIYSDCQNCIKYDIGNPEDREKIEKYIRLHEINMTIAMKDNSPNAKKEIQKKEQCDKCFGQRIREFDESFLESISIQSPYAPKKE